MLHSIPSNLFGEMTGNEGGRGLHLMVSSCFLFIFPHYFLLLNISLSQPAVVLPVVSLPQHGFFTGCSLLGLSLIWCALAVTTFPSEISLPSSRMSSQGSGSSCASCPSQMLLLLKYVWLKTSVSLWLKFWHPLVCFDQFHSLTGPSGSGTGQIIASSHTAHPSSTLNSTIGAQYKKTKQHYNDGIYTQLQNGTWCFPYRFR